MAGGKGTRLRPLTSERAKPMAPILNRPILEHIIYLLKSQGIKDIIITTCYKKDQIENIIGNGSRFGVSIDYVLETHPLGTAGSVKEAADRLTDTFLVVSGDALTDFPLREAVLAHRRQKALATMIVTEVEDPRPYGIVLTEPNGRVRRFLEKPSEDEVFSNEINTGIYVLEPEVLAGCPPGKPYDFSRDLFPKMLHAGQDLFVHRCDGYWTDIGACDQYVRANLDALNGRVKLSDTNPGHEQVLWIDQKAEVHPHAYLVPPVMIGPGTRLKGRCRVGPGTVLGAGVEVQRGAIIERSVVLNDCQVGENASIMGAVLGAQVTVGTEGTVMDGAVLGDRAFVPASSVVPAGARVEGSQSTPQGDRISIGRENDGKGVLVSDGMLRSRRG